MSNIKILKLRMSHRVDDPEPMNRVLADYAGQRVEIPIPARFQIDVPHDVLEQESLQACELLAEALQDFVARMKKSRGFP